jgi:hypothetical protein
MIRYRRCCRFGDGCVVVHAHVLDQDTAGTCGLQCLRLVFIQVAIVKATLGVGAGWAQGGVSVRHQRIVVRIGAGLIGAVGYETVVIQCTGDANRTAESHRKQLSTPDHLVHGIRSDARLSGVFLNLVGWLGRLVISHVAAPEFST